MMHPRMMQIARQLASDVAPCWKRQEWPKNEGAVGRHPEARTFPGKGWYTLLRLYGPLEPWFDKTWLPGEMELAN